MPNDLTRPYHDGGIDTTELHRLAAQAASAYGLQSVGGSAYYYHGAAGGIAIPGAPEATLIGTFETGTISTNQNDYALPPGAGWLQAEPSSAIDWTGFAGGAEGRVLRLTNTGTATLTLRHQSSSSSAANRIITPDGLSYAVAAGESAVLVYDAEDQRWRVQDRTTSAIATTTPAWVKVTKSHTDFQTAATTNDIEIYSLPAGGVVSAVKVKHSVQFAGTGIATYLFDGIGIAGSLTKYWIAAQNLQLHTAVSATNGVYNANFGANLLTIESQTAATSIRGSVTSTGANLDQSTAGSVDIWLLVSTAT